MVVTTVLLALTLLMKLINCEWKLYQKIAKYLEKTFLYNATIRILIESFLAISISSSINILNNDSTTIGNILSLILSYLT